ncbi:hypothetical protein CKAH01_09533 [Colletotrichum kahawae]|uniref:Uncharacterized protein n=1 Tax=Colletotrichum kahawae TaxID=34407 RepID=A0AAD9XY74_COLKA|nr:hypothetical protein CKAH01_09533 [Colletotrichum kahawae]
MPVGQGGNGVDEKPGAQAMMTRNREMSSVGKQSGWARSSDPNRNTNTPGGTHISLTQGWGIAPRSAPVCTPYTDVLRKLTLSGELLVTAFLKFNQSTKFDRIPSNGSWAPPPMPGYGAGDRCIDSRGLPREGEPRCCPWSVWTVLTKAVRRHGERL